MVKLKSEKYGIDINGSNLYIACRTYDGGREQITDLFERDSDDLIGDLIKPETDFYFSVSEKNAIIKRVKINDNGLLDPDKLKAVLEELDFKNIDELYGAVGLGDITAAKIIETTREKLVEYFKSVKDHAREDIVERRKDPQGIAGNLGIIVDGNPDVFIRLAPCCQPIPGDQITGFATNGKSISVHQSECPIILKVVDK